MSDVAATYAPGSLVRARGREWVVLPESEPDFLVLRPLGGGQDDAAAVLPALEEVTPATFPLPTAADLGDTAAMTKALTGATGAWLLSPPNFAAKDFIADRKHLMGSLAKAIKDAGTKNVVGTRVARLHVVSCSK